MESLKTEGERRTAKLASLEVALAERDLRISELSTASKPKPGRVVLRPQPSRRIPRAAVKSDDLQRISGIGPVLAKKLRRIGFATFDQLAALSRTDLQALALKLGIAAERIRREGWISSARGEARARAEN